MITSPTVGRLKALADPTRLRILELLREEELTVRELTDVLGMAQSRVSGHLAVLKESGLVRDRRQGTSHFYSPADGDATSTWRAVRETAPPPPEAERDQERLAGVLLRRREREREFFDRAAAGWDEERSEGLGILAGSLALAGLLPRELTVLDLGTGTGRLLPMLARHLDRVIAVDLSRSMLAKARGRVPRGRVRFLRADAARLPVADASVDGVVANMILHHLDDPAVLLREVARVLRPGGQAVIVDFEAHEEGWLLEEEGHRWPGFDAAQLGGWCVDAGLGIPEFERVPTPGSGRWSRLRVFVARLGRARKRERVRARRD
jgi:ArsR family transcriptional regulator